MPICERCGKEYNADRAAEIFENRFNLILPYDDFIQPLCGDCAVDIIEGEVEGFYYKKCGNCGKRFDYSKDSSKYYRYSNGETDLTDCWWSEWKILCAKCAIKYMKEQHEMFKSSEEGDYYLKDFMKITRGKLPE